MPDETAQFEAFFRTAFGNEPFDYQRRLATSEALHSLVNVPTGAGKTAAILGAWLWRRLHRPASVGRRLVYCLPMRTLVEQTVQVARTALDRLTTRGMDEAKRFDVRVLMGGEVSDEVSDAWDAYPEREYILIGTQDMLLSRALNRGYAMSRFRWPVHFGLLHNDCLWVFDEVQLMADGLATSAQLAAFRAQYATFGTSASIWMSATLDRAWLQTVDFSPQVQTLATLELSQTDRATSTLARRLTAVKYLAPAPPDCRTPEGLAAFVKAHHAPGTQTLVVVNRVARARETFIALEQHYGLTPVRRSRRGQAPPPDVSRPELLLLHARFRPAERRTWTQQLSATPGEHGRIIVATQVIEAGVDISSVLLVTDIAPYASLVQRFGRCNRAGECDAARIFWIDRPLNDKESNLAHQHTLDPKEQERMAMPYLWQDLETARELLASMLSAAPTDLPVHHTAYTPAHVLRRRDVIDLFDTTPDLSGYDLDISRFVRGGDERDLSVAWRALGDSPPRL